LDRKKQLPKGGDYKKHVSKKRKGKVTQRKKKKKQTKPKPLRTTSKKKKNTPTPEGKKKKSRKSSAGQKRRFVPRKGVTRKGGPRLVGEGGETTRRG